MKPSDAGTRVGLDLALLVAGRIGLLGASAASLQLTTRVLGPAELGAMNLALAAFLLPGLLVAGVGQFFYRQAMAWLIDGSLAANVRRYAAFLAVAGSAAAAVAAALPAAWLPLPTGWFALLLAGQLAVAGLQQALLHLVNLRGQRLPYVLLGNVVAWGGLGLATLACARWGARAPHWLAGLLAAQALVLVLAAAMLARQPGAGVAGAAAAPFSLRAAGAYAGPLVVCLALHWAQRSLPLPWLAGAEGRAAVGLFSAAFSLGMLSMLSFDALFKELYTPRYERDIAHAGSAARVRAWEHYAAAFFPAALAAFVCTAAAGPALLRLLTAPAFHGLGAYVAWGAACQWLLSLYSLVMLQAASAMDNRALVLPNAAGALVTAALLYAPAPLGAAMQTALATAAGMLTTTVLAAWRVRRVHAARWPWRRMAAAGAAACPAWGLAGLAPSVAAVAGIALLGTALQWGLARRWLLPQQGSSA